MKTNKYFITNPDYHITPDFSMTGDSALTLKCGKITVSQKYVTCHTGMGVEMNKNEVSLLFPRSSITKYDWILGNSVGVIDESYRGEIQLRFKPLSFRTRLLMKLYPSNTFLSFINKDTNDNATNILNNYKRWLERLILRRFDYRVGDKCGQIVILENLTTKQMWSVIETPSKSERGNGGFGSTGK